ncbi:hypothetical protein [Pseudomonas putida]|uniref:hypothetical protein n=1 Tax=Pseudomonas putida TaxID=303 RepID=UPI000D3D7594|nr:hypothetical protein [Pseudomonas putida]PTV51802.1 hypothetical protein DBL03_25450 [Pseudomonas putida]
MESDTSRKKSQGRPKLDPLEKQRRLVARLHENADELLQEIEEDSCQFHYADYDPQHHLLASTFNQRMSFAREIAALEHAGSTAEAKTVRQRLNLFRPLGFTEEDWNALPEADKRLAPGKPKMPKELELARLEIERDEELKKLRETEAEFDAEPADIESLRAMHGNNKAGRPGKDILGMLDKQLSIAFYKRRDLDPDREKKTLGRPQKSHAERYAYFTSIIDHCRSQISERESKLDLVHLQQRYLKRLRDRASRLRLRIGGIKGVELVSLKQDLMIVEEQLKVETGLFNDYQDNYITMSQEQIDSRKKSVAKKIKAFDSIEFSADSSN